MIHVMELAAKKSIFEKMNIYNLHYCKESEESFTFNEIIKTTLKFLYT